MTVPQTMETINIIERTAKVIADSAGCAIGYESAFMVFEGTRGFREDYEEHVQHGRCISVLSYPVPCVSACPAHVDVPGYVALVNEGRYEEAVKLIRRTTPSHPPVRMSASIPVKHTVAARWWMMLSISVV